MYIHEEKRIIFLDNVKCGGCYLRMLLLKHYDFKEVAKDYNLYRNMDDYFVFTFVRNPYEKIISEYKYLKRDIIEEFIERGVYNIIKTPENIDYYMDLPTFILNREKVCNHAFITQYDMLINDDNTINISFIGRKESLDSDLLKILGLCHFDIAYVNMLDSKINVNQSICDTEDITEFYDEYSFLFVNQFYDVDFETFGYKKYESFQEFKNHYMSDKMLMNNLVKQQKKNMLLDVYKLTYQQKMAQQDIQTQLDMFRTNIETLKKQKKNYELAFLTLLEKDVSKMNDGFQKSMEEIDHLTDIFFKETYFFKDEKSNSAICFTCENCHYNTYNELSFHCHNKTCKI